MNTMLQRVADAIETAIAEPYYEVKNHSDLGWCIVTHDDWHNMRIYYTIEIGFSAEEAEDRCEELTKEYIAKRAIESLLLNSETTFNDFIWNNCIKEILK